MKILVVDDEPLFLEIMQAELEVCGISDIRFALSGDDALRLVRAAVEPFDCFLLDINMPKMNGIELCALLRAEPAARQIPIIMVTVRSEMESVDMAFTAGATDYLTKPLNSRELRGRMRMVKGLAEEREARKKSLLNSNSEEQFSFETPLRLDVEHSCMEYLAIQNYVLKQGAMRMFNWIVLGVRVTNATELLTHLGQASFKDTMTDVGETVLESLDQSKVVISYAGSGTFVALVPRFPGLDKEQLFDRLQVELSMLNNFYQNTRQMKVRVDVAAPVYRGLFSYLSPTEMLEKAINDTWSPMFSLGIERNRTRRLPRSNRKAIEWKAW